MRVRAAGFGKTFGIRLLDSRFERKPGGLQTEANIPGAILGSQFATSRSTSAYPEGC